MKKNITRFPLLLLLLLAMCTLITALPVGVMAAEEVTTIAGQQLYLGDDLTMHFYGDIAQSHTADAVATITVAGEEVCSYPVSEMTAGKNGTYDFSVELAAAQMTDSIVVSITSGGTEVFNKTYSVRDYLVYLLNGAYTADTKQLVKELLNYGAAAQTYFEYNTDALANAGYQIEATATIPDEAPAIDLSGKVSGASFYGASMLFRSKIAVRFYFTVESSLEDYDVSIPGNSFTVGQKDNLYYIEVADIMPQDMETALNLTVTKGEESLTISYSPITYIVRMYNNANTSANLKALLVAANSYFAAAKETVVAMNLFLNDFTDLTGTKITYTDAWNGQKTATPVLTAEGNANHWIAAWTKANSLEFYAPLKLSKTEVKSLLDSGYTEFEVSLFQSAMNETPWWGLTNKVSADWTNETYSISSGSMKAMSFSLQNMYDNYDTLADGTMPLLKIDIDGLADNDGGVWVDETQSWISSSYNIIIAPIRIIDTCKHNVATEWETDGENHWKTCSDCGEKVENGAHSLNWTSDEAGHYQSCAVCGLKQSEGSHNWESISGGKQCTECGYKNITYFKLNDFTDTTGLQMTYVNKDGTAQSSTVENGLISVSGTELKARIPQWTKPGSLEFHMPLKLSKSEVKNLLDAGIKEFKVTVQQGPMKDSPWWGLTSNISAEWTSATYSATTDEGWKTLTFSLQDLYDNYDDLADGTMALLKFSIADLWADDGGLSHNGEWKSTGYNILIKDIEGGSACNHSVGESWEHDSTSHWKTCALCGEKIEFAACTTGHYIAEEKLHYTTCSVCGIRKNETAHKWISISNYHKCSSCGYEKMLFIDFADTEGIKMTFVNSGDVAQEGTVANNHLTASGTQINAYIPSWVKPGSLKFYMPLKVTKDEVQNLLNSGITEFTITIQQSAMSKAPNWNLTNNVSADWTSAASSVNTADGWKVLTFSLQDLYDNFDAIADGTMALLNFSIAELDSSDGGIWVEGTGWMSSSYNIWIRDVGTAVTGKYDDAAMVALLKENKVSVDGVANTRDLGGFYTEDGKYKVRTEMIFRGANLDGITATGLETLLGTYGINTHIDLRELDQSPDWSPLGSSVNYYTISAPYYDDIFLSNRYETVRSMVEPFTSEENYPIYFHCQIGRDRTGTLALLINALLGVNEEDLIAEFQLTFYNENGPREYEKHTANSLWSSAYRVIAGLRQYPGNTLAECTENYLLAIGLTQNQIDSIRSIMLEPVGAAAPQNTVLNDFTDLTGIQTTYVYSWGTEKTSVPVLTAEGNANMWIDQWAKANSLKFYMPMNLSKEDIKALLDFGCTEIEVSLYQSAMNETPWWPLTNNVSADWTDATYSVSGWTTMYFSLQDLYNNYDALADGTMPLLKFDIDGLADNDGGVWVDETQSWISSSYNIIISPIKVVNSCKHNTDTEWESSEDGHWKTCTLCGEKVSNNAHSFGIWTSDENGHYQDCTACGFKQNQGEHSWQTVPGGQKCSYCGYRDTISNILNDFSDTQGVRMSFVNSGGTAQESTVANGRITVSGQQATISIPTWIKPNTLKFYMPLTITKDDVKALLDMGCTEVEVSVSQSAMTVDPWWGLTNNVSADWTTATYSVAATDGWKTLTFTLQDLYNNYDAIAGGTMPFLKFTIVDLDVNDGGIWTGKWISPSYNISLSNIKVKMDTVLNEKLAGKYVSILGDSISTYQGVSNGNNTANTTISGYNSYYANQMSVNDTYWGQLISQYNMNLLVNNSCGGNTLLNDSGSGVTAPAGYKRVDELAGNTGELTGIKPDMIFIFMGTNDLHANLPLGELTEATYGSVVSGDGYITPATFTEAYIITLEKASKLYPDAQIYVFTLIPNSWGRDDTAYNARIRELAAHYPNVSLVDVAANSGITSANCSSYTYDVLHPNNAGMAAIARVLEEAILENN